MSASNLNTSRIELLSKDNYDTWSIQVEALLIKNDLWDFVNGTNRIPSEDGAGKNSWLKSDKKARADLVLSIQPSELKRIRGCATARDVWLKLESIYASKGPARKAALLKQLLLQKLDENGDVKEHICKFFDVVDKLENMEVPINGDLLSIMLLYSLPRTYENFRCAIECRDELPTPEALKIKIIEESEARQNTTTDTVVVMSAEEKFKTKSKSFHADDKLKGKGRILSRVFRCYRCGKSGHKASICPTNKNSHPDASFAVFEEINLYTSSNVAYSGHASKEWMLDSGCTAHLCGDKSAFCEFKFEDHMSLNLANQSCATVLGKGNVNVIAKDKDSVRTIHINDALYVPDLRSNLLSIAKITDKGYNVIFNKYYAYITDAQQKVIHQAERRGNLYYLKLSEECAMAEDKNIHIMKWHCRLGHLNADHIKRLVKDKIIPNIDASCVDILQNCVICAQGKMSAKPFKSSKNVCKEPLEIVHTDVCGPFRVESTERQRYFVTFIDGYSKWGKIYFLRKKSDVLEAFKVYHKMIENQSGKRIKCLQSDNGLEYLNSDFDNYLNSHGISRRTTIAHTPQQNGTAERYNRTIMDMARCLLIQSGLSESHWSAAVSAACHIRNRCPSNSINGLTPYEKLFKRKPNLSHLRTFGSRVAVMNKDPTKSKLAPRAIEGVFIGYPLTQKGYRVWLPNERKMIVARDVKFLNELINSNSFNNQNSDLLSTDNQPEKNYLEIIMSDSNDEMPDVSNRDEDDHTNMRGSRAPGRPRINRTGQKGRPQKVYQFRSATNFERLPTQITSEPEKGEDDNLGSNNLETPDEEEDQNDVFIDAECSFVGNAEINYERALQSAESEEWENAIEIEIVNILRNDTWKIVTYDGKTIGCRFVLTNKYTADGKLDRRKARLVAKGFSQQYGVNYNQTFAPVARLETVRLVLAIAVQFGLLLWQFDVVAAYLNGELKEDVFMRIPQNLKEILVKITQSSSYDNCIRKKAQDMLKDISDGGNSCQLKKALYGLKQAGRAWYSKLRSKLESLGLKPADNEPCLFYGKVNEHFTLVLVYVDDLLVATSKKEVADSVSEQLSKHFDIKKLGVARSCIGLDIIQGKSKIILNQKQYIHSLLSVYGMSECNHVSTPAEPTLHSHCMKNQPYTGGLYRSLIGALLYLSVASRPDIANVVSRLAQFVNEPLYGHWTAAKRVLRYLAGTADRGLTYSKTEQPLIAYSDSDWGGCSVDRRSYSGYVFILSGAAVAWKSQKQRTVALSSTEAEYISLAETAKEAIYLKNLLNELELAIDTNMIIYVDNKGAEHLAKDPIVHSRTKHIDIKFHFLRDCIKNNIFSMKHVSTQQMIAEQNLYQRQIMKNA